MRALTLCFVSFLVCASEARAEDTPDLRVLGEALHEQLGALTGKPDQGWEGREFYAWKVYLKPRASRMNRRVLSVLDQKWILSDKGRAIALPPTQWTRVIQELCGLHPELAAADKGYRGVKVSEKRARRIWDRAHPIPKSIVGTPSYSTLTALRSDILHHQRLGYLIPSSWYERERNLERQCQLELVSQQQAWKTEKEQAYLGIKTSADETRTALREKQDAFGAAAKLAYDWMAALQEAEERILKKKIAPLEGDARKTADALVKNMAAGRLSAIGRRHTSSARYGQAIRQGWAGPRNKLLALLKKKESPAPNEKAPKDEAPTEDAPDK